MFLHTAYSSDYNILGEGNLRFSEGVASLFKAQMGDRNSQSASAQRTANPLSHLKLEPLRTNCVKKLCGELPAHLKNP